MSSSSLDETTVGSGPRPPAEPGNGPFQLGDWIARYRLQTLLGEGGMGRVYAALQSEPVQRTVALKVLSAPMLSALNLARFDVERQSLAQMSHPAIAQVYDAGTTEDGWPWLAMELVDGLSITEYARSHQLDLRARVELMKMVCRGVQHAHLKGILHRDLKPANVLVTSVDGQGLPKIIDFGIASATSGGSRDERGRSVGTPAYMSPEQAANSGQIDQRSDVYSLGLILYELVSGRHPRASSDLDGLDSGELHRRLLARTIPAPSQNGAERDVNWELDAICLRALENDPERRYQSAAELASDLDAWLRGFPVSALAPGSWYRMRKLAERNRIAVAALGLMLIGAIVAASLLTRAYFETREAWAEAERQRQQSEQIAGFQQSMITGLDPFSFGGSLRQLLLEQLSELQPDASWHSELQQTLTRNASTDLARKVLDQEILRRASGIVERDFMDQPALALRMLNSLASMYQAVGIPDLQVSHALKARELARSQLQQHDPQRLQLEHAYALALYTNQRQNEALEEYEALIASMPWNSLDQNLLLQNAVLQMSLTLFQLGEHQRSQDLLAELEAVQPEDPAIRTTILTLKREQLSFEGRHQEALAPAREAYRLASEVFGPGASRTTSAMGSLAIALARAGEMEEALGVFEAILQIRREQQGSDHPLTLQALNNLAITLMRVNRIEEAHGMLEQVVNVGEIINGRDHPMQMQSQNNLAAVLMDLNRYDEALSILDDLVERRQRLLGPGHPSTLSSLQNLVDTQLELGGYQQALPLAEELLRQRTQIHPAGHHELMAAIELHARALANTGRHLEAIPALQQILQKPREDAGNSHRNIHISKRLRLLLHLLEAQLALNQHDAARQSLEGEPAQAILEAIQDVELPEALLQRLELARQALGVTG